MNLESRLVMDLQWTDPLPKLLINPAATDHHIWRSLPDLIHEKHSEYSTVLIRTVIWECSSSLNIRYKRTQTKEWKDCWLVIRSTFKKLTVEYLSRILSNHNLI